MVVEGGPWLDIVNNWGLANIKMHNLSAVLSVRKFSYFSFLVVNIECLDNQISTLEEIKKNNQSAQMESQLL